MSMKSTSIKILVKYIKGYMNSIDNLEDRVRALLLCEYNDESKVIRDKVIDRNLYGNIRHNNYFVTVVGN